VLRFLFWTCVILFAAAAWLAWGAWRRYRFSRDVERALDHFRRNRINCEKDFFTAAAATGKPRGLAWKKCELQDGLVLARDRANGELIGLVAATISFEAIEGGDMEEVEAVGNLRAATAIFTWTGHEWTTPGRAVFNLEPHEVLDRYRNSLDPIGSIMRSAPGEAPQAPGDSPRAK
jgi:hypothetical protein